MTNLYKPRPERWPQVSLRGLLVLTAVAAILLPSAIATYRAWWNSQTPSPYYVLDGPQYFAPGPEFKLSREAIEQAALLESGAME